MYFVIGLGNPGEKYKNTRHNFAWILFDLLIPREEWLHEPFLSSHIAHLSSNGEEFIFTKPLTYMNHSGEIIPLFRKKYGHSFSSENIIVVHDDLDILFGDIRLVYGRGDAGHNGVKSVFRHLGTKNVWRVRLGIAKNISEEKTIKPPVLSTFSQEELNFIKSSVFPSWEQIVFKRFFGAQ